MNLIEKLYNKIVENLFITILYKLNDLLREHLGNYHIYILSAITILLLLIPFYFFVYIVIKIMRNINGNKDKIKFFEIIWSPFIFFLTLIIIIYNWIVKDMTLMTLSDKIIAYIVRIIAILMLFIFAGAIIILVNYL